MNALVTRNFSDALYPRLTKGGESRSAQAHCLVISFPCWCSLAVVQLWLGHIAQSKRGPTMIDFQTRFLRNENGATAIEYGLIVAGVALTILSAITAFGSAIKTSFFDVIAGALGT